MARIDNHDKVETMRRWNGWGEESVNLALDAGAVAYLRDGFDGEAGVGPGVVQPAATLAAIAAAMPPSRLPLHPAIDTSPEARLKAGLGQSWPDWLKLKYGIPGRLPDGVAFPEDSAQVRALLDLAAARGWIVIPYGGGTSVVGHLSCPDTGRPVLTLHLGRMSRLLDLDPLSQIATIGAGAAGPLVESQLRAHGYTLGHFPQSFEYSTLGGWVVTRSSGQQSLRYGRIEQLFAGGRLEAPAGTLTIPTFPASAAGPDLREMVLGSEGRLGVLTEVKVRVTPLPEHESFHAVFFPDWASAETAVRTLAQAKVPLSMLRLSNPMETMTNLRIAGHARLIGWLERYLNLRGAGAGRCLLMLGVTGSRRGCRLSLAEARRVAGRHGGVWIGQALGAKWAENRYRGPYLRNTLWDLGYGADTVETAADWPIVEATMNRVEDAARAAFAESGERVHAFTHLSHVYPQGSSIYTTFVYRLADGYAANLERWRRLKAAACEVMVAQGTTISHQHGVGRDHRPYLPAEKGPLGMAAIADLARRFDPEGIMNPGCLFGTDGGEG